MFGLAYLSCWGLPCSQKHSSDSPDGKDSTGLQTPQLDLCANVTIAGKSPRCSDVVPRTVSTAVTPFAASLSDVTITPTVNGKILKQEGKTHIHNSTGRIRAFILLLVGLRECRAM